MRNRGLLVLSDGSVFCGKMLYHGSSVVTGEVVFVTAMTGYVEILTDPSYCGQIIVFTYPEIGNYGVSIRDFQSEKIQVKAIVVRNLSPISTSYFHRLTLSDWFQEAQVPIFYGIDTRKLILEIRAKGSMMGALAKEHHSNVHKLFDQAKNSQPMRGKKLSNLVCVNKPKIIKIEESHRLFNFRVVVLDFGVKRNIIKHLREIFKEIVIMPGYSSVESIWRCDPCGVLLSNGPGDPECEKGAIKLTRALLGKVPIFGICLGHQILAQALGFNIYKLKFGHRGSNHSVQKSNGKLITTSQNHGFAVNMNKNLPKISRDINLSDDSIEGISVPELFAFSVQFHPEGAPGPHDALSYFRDFAELIKKFLRFKNRDQHSKLRALEQKGFYQELPEGISDSRS